jgi:hypothetical protein
MHDKDQVSKKREANATSNMVVTSKRRKTPQGTASGNSKAISNTKSVEAADQVSTSAIFTPNLPV